MALPLFRLQPDGFANKDLRALTAELRGLDPATVTAGQITYDLRRLRVRGLITRIPHTHRYRLTEHGLHTAMFISAAHDRFLSTGLAQLADELTSPPLRAASRTYRNALDKLAWHNRFGRLTPTADRNTPNLTRNSAFAGSSLARPG